MSTSSMQPPVTAEYSANYVLMQGSNNGICGLGFGAINYTSQQWYYEPLVNSSYTVISGVPSPSQFSMSFPGLGLTPFPWGGFVNLLNAASNNTPGWNENYY